MILPDGKATLKASSVSQSFSEEGAAIDSRDLKAVHRYLLTGKKENGGQTIGPNQLQQSEPPLQKKAEEKKEAVEKEGVEKQKAVEKKTDIKQPGSKNSSWPVLVTICSCAIAAALFVLVLKNCQQKSHVETATRSYADFVWQGQWKNGKPNGEGVARYHDGRIYRGRMVKGVRKDKDAPNAPLFITTHGLCRRYDRNTLNFPCQLYRNTNRRFVLPPCYSFSAAYKLYH